MGLFDVCLDICLGIWLDFKSPGRRVQAGRLISFLRFCFCDNSGLRLLQNTHAWSVILQNKALPNFLTYLESFASLTELELV